MATWSAAIAAATPAALRPADRLARRRTRPHPAGLAAGPRLPTITRPSHPADGEAQAVERASDAAAGTAQPRSTPHLPIRWAAGLALLAAVAAGCSAHHATGGTANPRPTPVSHPASTAPKPPATPPRPPATPPATHRRATAPPAPPTTTRLTTPPPKPTGDNGGDHDADNNGGPDDGDGTIQPPSAITEPVHGPALPRHEETP